MMKKSITRFIVLIASTGLCPAVFAQFISNTGIDIRNSTHLVTNGDWNNSSGNIVNDGVIRTSAAFINSGTLDIKSTGGFELDFATDTEFRPGGSRMGYLTKTGSGAALVTGTTGVRDSLLIKSGVIRLYSAVDTVWMGAGAVLLAGETNWVEGGFIARGGKGDLVFPFGKDGLYVPLKMYKVDAEQVTAEVLDAPANYTAGPGVDALIGFPYAWRVKGKAAADTAAYVSINYPNSLPVVSDPIVVREIPNQEYASMGARFIEDSGTRTTVKSYSRRLNGLYTVARGFPSDPVTDSLALVSLYNSTGGPQWTSAANWLTGTIDTWFGVTVNGQSITAVELPANNLIGPVADPLVDILSLQTVNLSANQITFIPDFTLNPEISSLNVSDNHLDFGSLEPNASVAGINYLTQAEIGVPSENEIPVGSSYEFTLPSQGVSSEYQWRFNGQDIIGATGASYILPAIGRETMGDYEAQVTHPLFPGLILNSAVQRVAAYATVSGKLFADTDVPAAQGELTLYKVQPGAFAPIQTISVAADGSYLFDHVILDDYQIRGFADTLLYERALPTYYQSTILWEEADTLQLASNLSSLDIVSQLEPGPPSGRGSITGVLQEDDGTGRNKQIERNRRIGNAGVSARRVERTGRTKGEILTLVAYVFTNADGEFTLPNLPTGEYRLNFQYPGYPMDETSYTTITIGTGLESQVMVEANVLNNKINVRKLLITGLDESETYHADVFPNPAADHVHLRFAGAVEGRTVLLTDLQGKSLYSQDASQKEVSVSVRPFRNGIYVMQIREKGLKVKTLKVSIE